MKSKTKFILLAVFLIFSFFVAIFSSYYGLNLKSAEYFISGNHNLAAFFYSVLFIALSSFSFSVSAMTSFGTLLFSEHEVIFYSMIGIMGSSIVHFYLSKKLGRTYVQNYLEKKGGKLEKFDEILEKNTFKTIFLLSAIFFVPPTMINLLGGIMKIKFRNYCIATFIGNLPNTIFTVYLISGILYSNALRVYVSVAGLILTTLIALFFYGGEIKEFLNLIFPWAFRRE